MVTTLGRGGDTLGAAAPARLLRLERRAREPSELERLLREPRACRRVDRAAPLGIGRRAGDAAVARPVGLPGHLHPQECVGERIAGSRRRRDAEAAPGRVAPVLRIRIRRPSASKGPGRYGSCRSRSASCAAVDEPRVDRRGVERGSRRGRPHAVIARRSPAGTDWPAIAVPSGPPFQYWLARRRSCRGDAVGDPGPVLRAVLRELVVRDVQEEPLGVRRRPP